MVGYTILHLYMALVAYILGFVDDNSLQMTFREGESLDAAINKGQKALTSWKRLLQITGGNLALEKCVFSYMG